MRLLLASFLLQDILLNMCDVLGTTTCLRIVLVLRHRSVWRQGLSWDCFGLETQSVLGHIVTLSNPTPTHL